jgi:hypothetical protein
MKELLILTADKNAEYTVRSVAERVKAVERISFSYDIITHPRQDAGVCKYSVEYVRPFIKSHERLLAMFDYEGCGREGIPRMEIEDSVEKALSNNGGITDVPVLCLNLNWRPGYG